MSPLLQRSLLKKLGFAAVGVTLGVLLLNSCDDIGYSPYAPVITYKKVAISAFKNTAILPDYVVASGDGVIDGYSVSPALPTGLTLDAKTGTISGTPTAGTPCQNYVVSASGPSGHDTSTVTICVSDSANTYRVNKGPFPPFITYKRLSIEAVKNKTIRSDTVIDTTGGAITSYSVTPALPAGLALNTANGVISGKPTTTDTAARLYTITATGPSGTGDAHIGICIAPDSLHPCVADVRPPSVYYNESFIWTTPGVALVPDSANSFAGRITKFTVSPALPAGISLDSVKGIISGTPTATVTARDYHVLVTGPFGIDSSQIIYIAVFDNNIPQALLKKGKARFSGVCSGCHGQLGLGAPPDVHPGRGATPPLAHSDFLMANRHRPIRIQMMGLPNAIDSFAPIIVAGDTYDSHMPSVGGNDSDIASVLTFVRAMFNGATDYISVSEVAHVRDSVAALDCDRDGQRDGCGIDTTH